MSGGTWKRQMRKAARDVGFTEKMGGKHIKLMPPSGGRAIVLPKGTVSEGNNSARRVEQQLREHGADV